MSKKIDPALLDQMYSRMTLEQLQEMHQILVDQISVLDKHIAQKSPEVTGDD